MGERWVSRCLAIICESVILLRWLMFPSRPSDTHICLLLHAESLGWKTHQVLLWGTGTTLSTSTTSSTIISPPPLHTLAASPPSPTRQGPPPLADKIPGCLWISAGYEDASVCSWWPPAWCCQWWWFAGSNWTTVLSTTSSHTPIATWSTASPTSIRASPSHESRPEASATSDTCWTTQISARTRTSSSSSLSKRPQRTLRGEMPSDPPGVMRPTSKMSWEWQSRWCLPWERFKPGRTSPRGARGAGLVSRNSLSTRTISMAI